MSTICLIVYIEITSGSGAASAPVQAAFVPVLSDQPPAVTFAPGMTAEKFTTIVTNLESEIERLKQLRLTTPHDIYDKAQLDAYRNTTEQILLKEAQLKKLVEDNADAYIQMNLEYWKGLANKATLTPAE